MSRRPSVTESQFSDYSIPDFGALMTEPLDISSSQLGPNDLQRPTAGPSGPSRGIPARKPLPPNPLIPKMSFETDSSSRFVARGGSRGSSPESEPPTPPPKDGIVNQVPRRQLHAQKRDPTDLYYSPRPSPSPTEDPTPAAVRPMNVSVNDSSRQTPEARLAFAVATQGVPTSDDPTDVYYKSRHGVNEYVPRGAGQSALAAAAAELLRDREFYEARNRAQARELGLPPPPRGLGSFIPPPPPAPPVLDYGLRSRRMSTEGPRHAPLPPRPAPPAPLALNYGLRTSTDEPRDASAPAPRPSLSSSVSPPLRRISSREKIVAVIKKTVALFHKPSVEEISSAPQWDTEAETLHGELRAYEARMEHGRRFIDPEVLRREDARMQAELVRARAQRDRERAHRRTQGWDARESDDEEMGLWCGKPDTRYKYKQERADKWVENLRRMEKVRIGLERKEKTVSGKAVKAIRPIVDTAIKAMEPVSKSPVGSFFGGDVPDGMMINCTVCGRGKRILRNGHCRDCLSFFGK